MPIVGASTRLVGALIRRVSLGAASLLVLSAAPGPGSVAAGQEAAGVVEVRSAARHDTSPPLREIAEPPEPTGGPVPARGPLRRELPTDVADRASGSSRPPSSHTPSAITGPITSFEGVSNLDNQSLGEGLPVPPDTVGDVGPEHYVQMTNVVTKVFDRDGNVLLGPVKNSSFWNGLGGLCENTNEGDPIVLFDPLVDNPTGPDGRWVVSQFAFDLDQNGDPVPPFRQCVAVSATGDPTGSYHRYDFFWSNNEFNDYPKLGVWPDAYFLSVNEFSGPSLSYDSASVAALERDAMLQGQAADLIEIDLEGINPNSFSLLPSDVDGTTPPPPGSPNYLFELRDNVFWGPPIGLHAWKFDVDFGTPSNSTLTGPQIVNTDDYNILVCQTQYPLCVSQPNTNTRLDVLSDRLMHRNAYRNFGTHESLVLAHSVRVGGQQSQRSGIAWYEIRNPSGSPPTLFQQGTFSPDTDHRWMPSIAMNEDGSVAVGYSVSSDSVFPSIRYAGRAATDPPGTMAQGEATLMDGNGSQTHFSGRWGDYSAMSVDPLDEETFWYTNEYYASTSQRGWNTRVGAFSITPAVSPATCLGQAATIVGTASAEQLTGTPGDDVIVSRGGADDIQALAGDDLVCAGRGGDEVDGGAEADTILGQQGRDGLAGRGGRDDLRGGDEDDVLRGNRGNDTLSGGPDDDLLNGGQGTDQCGGGPGQDQLIACES